LSLAGKPAAIIASIQNKEYLPNYIVATLPIRLTQTPTRGSVFLDRV
jgi:hypothetical protein